MCNDAECSALIKRILLRVRQVNRSLSEIKRRRWIISEQRVRCPQCKQFRLLRLDAGSACPQLSSSKLGLRRRQIVQPQGQISTTGVRCDQRFDKAMVLGGSPSSLQHCPRLIICASVQVQNSLGKLHAHRCLHAPQPLSQRLRLRIGVQRTGPIAADLGKLSQILLHRQHPPDVVSTLIERQCRLKQLCTAIKRPSLAGQITQIDICIGAGRQIGRISQVQGAFQRYLRRSKILLQV